MIKLGPIFDVDETKRYLSRVNRDYNRQLTWQNLFSGINFGAASAQSAIQQSHTADISQAYTSYMRNQTALQNTGLVGSSLEAYQTQNEQALQQAYDTYMSHLRESSSGIEEQRQSSQQAVDDALTLQARNTADYAEAHLDYLQYLAYQNPEMLDSRQWSMYTTAIGLTPEEEERLVELEGLMKLNKHGDVKRHGDDYDESNRMKFKGSNKKLDAEYRELIAKRDGTGTVAEGLRRVMTREELTSARKDEEGRDIGLFDAEGNITLRGINFFDQLQNSPELFGDSFSQFLTSTDVEWLMDTHEGMTRSEAQKIAQRNTELYSWSRERNPFDYTVDEYGQSSNIGSFRTMVGLASDDAKYSFLERAGGYTESEINEMYKSFKETFDSIKDLKDIGSKGKKQIKEFQKASEQIFELVRDLGLGGELAKANITEASIADTLERAYLLSKSKTDIDLDFVFQVLTGAGAGAGAGAVAGAAAAAPQQALPVLGQATGAATVVVATLIGALAGGISTYTSLAGAQKKRAEAQTREQYNLSKEAYLNMLTEIISITQSARKQAERDKYFTGR